MAKIYISPETLKKLSEKNNYNEILHHFDANRPEPKNHNRANNNTTNKTVNNKHLKNNKPKQSKPSNKIRYVTLNVLKQPPKKSKKSIPQRKVLMGDITEHRYTAPVKQSTTFFYSPSFKNHNSAAAFNKGKEMKNPHIHLNYLKEHHLLAGESAQMIKDPKRQYIKTKTKNVSTIQRAKKHKKPNPIGPTASH